MQKQNGHYVPWYVLFSVTVWMNWIISHSLLTNCSTLGVWRQESSWHRSGFLVWMKVRKDRKMYRISKCVWHCLQYRAVPEDMWWVEGLDRWEDQWNQLGRRRQRPGVSQSASAQTAESWAGVETHWRQAEQNEYDGKRVCISSLLFTCYCAPRAIKCATIFDYNSCISQWIFVPLYDCK